MTKGGWERREEGYHVLESSKEGQGTGVRPEQAVSVILIVRVETRARGSGMGWVSGPTPSDTLLTRALHSLPARLWEWEAYSC